MAVTPSQYPISRLLARIQKESGLSRHDFSLAIGYKNVTSALRKMDQFLTTGSGENKFLELVLNRFPERAPELKQAVMETAKIMEEEDRLAAIEAEKEARRRFRPYIFVETSLSRPTSITYALFCGFKMKFLHLSEEREHTLEEIRETIRAHYDRNNGKCVLFGNIVGYRYVRSWEESIRLDIGGNVLEVDPGHFETPFAGAELRIGRKRLTTQQVGKVIKWDPDSGLN